MSIQAVGSSIQITYKTKAPTFTPEQLMRALKERQYVAMQGQATYNRNRTASPIIIPGFSKENVNIFYYPNETLFVVQILNTIDLTNVLEDLKPILVNLNITENVMANITFNCRTSIISSKNEPLKNLTSLVNSKFLDGINSMMNDNLKVGAIRLISGVEPSEDYTIEILLEPLEADPKREYSFIMGYRTLKMKRFNEFINKFGQDMITSIIKQVEIPNV